MPKDPTNQPTPRLRLLLVDDHPIVREGLRSILSEAAHLEVVAEAGDGLEAVECARALQPDLVLLDLSMPRKSGLEALPLLRRVSPVSRLLVATVHHTQEYLLKVRAAGADGFLLKDSSPAEYLEAIHVVMSGHFFASPALVRQPLANRGSRALLSRGELEFIRHAAAGLTAASIAEKMECSVAMVRTYRRRALEKTSLPSLASLVSHAVNLGWIGKDFESSLFVD